jgi:hypothetical protein
MDEELTILLANPNGNGPAFIPIGVPGAAHHVITSTTTKNSNETNSNWRNW